MQTDEGMFGSWFEATVSAYEFPDRLVVSYHELHDGGDDEDEDEEARPEGADGAEAPLLVGPEPVTRVTACNGV